MHECSYQQYLQQPKSRNNVSINWWMNKTEVYSYNEFYLAVKRKGNPDTYYDMDKPWKQNAKWKKVYKC